MRRRNKHILRSLLSSLIVEVLVLTAGTKLPLQGLDGDISGVQNVLKSGKPVSLCLWWEEQLAKLEMEPGVSWWCRWLWTGPGWRQRERHTAVLLSSPQLLSVPPSSSAATAPSVQSSAANPGWCPSASSAAHHALAPAAGMFR